jgi:protein-S-isoprenylcysteine O-methyltransferase Ste14
MSDQPRQSAAFDPPPPLVGMAFVILSAVIDRIFGTGGRLPRVWGLGLGLLVAGVGLGGWSTWVFRTVGEGTPAPNRPPRYLVDEGPYRFVRHPIYVGMLLVVGGLAVLRRSLSLAAMLPLFALWLRSHAAGEEEVLYERFGIEFERYRQRVPGWLPRLPSSGPESERG